MASTESLGLMLFTIEIMKERLTSSGFSPLTLAFTNCFRMPCIASRSTTPNASDMSRSPSSGSGWSRQNPCDNSFIRGTAAALVWSDAAIAVAIFGFGAVFMSTFLGTRVERARFGNAQAITSRGEPVQLQLWVGIFAQIAPNSALLRGHGRLTDCAMMKECR